MDSAIDAGIKASNADDFTAFVVANAAFRRAWMAQVPNTQLVAALARYIDHVQIIRLVTLTQRPVREDVLERLRAIHDAFQAGKARSCQHAVQAACRRSRAGVSDLSKMTAGRRRRNDPRTRRFN